MQLLDKIAFNNKCEENLLLETHLHYQKSPTLIPINLSLRAANLLARSLKTVTCHKKNREFEFKYRSPSEPLVL